jgi:hypothetical protein
MSDNNSRHRRHRQSLGVSRGNTDFEILDAKTGVLDPAHLVPASRKLADPTLRAKSWVSPSLPTCRFGELLHGAPCPAIPTVEGAKPKSPDRSKHIDQFLERFGGRDLQTLHDLIDSIQDLSMHRKK